MLGRRTSGSVVCPGCGSLVGVNDDRCYMCGRVNPGLWGFGPVLRRIGADLGFAQVVIGACVVIWLITLLLSGGGLAGGSMGSMLSPSQSVIILFGASGAYPVFGLHRWWTVLSAGWLHFGLLHIALNMYWVYLMGPAIAELFGPARTVIIYTVGGAAGFLLSSLAGLFIGPMAIPLFSAGSVTAGASAPVFGLIGALYHYGRTASGHIKQQALFMMLQALLFGLFIHGIDNYAHVGGFAGGYITSAWLNPMTRERGDHVVIALLCFGATLLSILWSVLSVFIR